MLWQGMPYFLIVSFYSFASALMTYPLVFNLRTSFISDGEWNDSPMYIWGLYAFKDALVHFQNPFFTDKLYFPLGTWLIMHTFTPIMGLFSLPFSNAILAANIFILLNFVLSAIGAYHLCNYYVKNKYLSIVAGFIFAFCPYKLAHLHSHFNLMLTAAIPFFVLCWQRAFQYDPAPRLRSKKHFVLALVFFAWAFLSEYTYALFLLAFVLFWCSYYGCKLYNFKIVRKKSIVLLLALVIIISNCVVLLLEKHHVPRTQFFLGSDVLSFFVPSLDSRLFAGAWTRYFHSALIKADPAENTVFLGYTLIALAVVVFVARRRRENSIDQRALLFFCACFTLLSMPMVHIAGKPVCALPHAIIQYIPFINNFRAPARYTVMVMLFLPIACFMALQHWLGKLPNTLQMLLAALILVMIGAEFIPNPFPLYSRGSLPRVYHYLASQPDGTLLEIPFGIKDGVSVRIGRTEAMNMYYQTVHHKKLLSGYISRLDKKKCEFFQTDPLIGKLLSLQQGNSDDGRGCSPEQLRASSAKFSVRYVLIYPEFRGTALETFVTGAFSSETESSTEIDRYLLITLKTNRLHNLEGKGIL